MSYTARKPYFRGTDSEVISQFIKQAGPLKTDNPLLFTTEQQRAAIEQQRAASEQQRRDLEQARLEELRAIKAQREEVFSEKLRAFKAQRAQAEIEHQRSIVERFQKRPSDIGNLVSRAADLAKKPTRPFTQPAASSEGSSSEGSSSEGSSYGASLLSRLSTLLAPKPAASSGTSLSTLWGEGIRSRGESSGSENSSISTPLRSKWATPFHSEQTFQASLAAKIPDQSTAIQKKPKSEVPAALPEISW